MLIEIILFLLLGIFAGTLSGLAPGIHINLIGAILVSLSSSVFAFVNPIYFAVFIVSMAIAHTFLDFIPSIFLGCPDTDTVLTILPGHELLKNGRGYEAIMMTNYGSFAAIFILIVISIPSVFLVPKIYNSISSIIPWILISVFLITIFYEKEKISAFAVFAISGILGLIILNIGNLNQPLLPLLSGLFGASSLIMSIKTKVKIPKQEITKPKVKFFKPLVGSLFASYICSFLPGLGSGQASAIGSIFSKKDRGSFLVLLGATNTLVMGLSFVALYAIQKTRTGAAASLQGIMGNLSFNILILILAVVLISGIISFFLTEKFARFFADKIGKINYAKFSFGTLIFLSIIVLAVSGIMGFFVFIISTLAGIYCISFSVRRTNMMGCLLLPTILIYLKIV